MEEQGGQPGRRRLVGIDLGIASRDSVRVLEAGGQAVCRSSCVPTVESLALVERAALAGAPEGTRLAVVLEPTGPAWLPIAVFFARRGHDVYRVSSVKAADLRRFLRRHAKSNGIDAETLARIPLADPGGLQRLELPGADAAALDRRVRACDRLTRAASEHKVRIKDLVRQLLPMTPLTGDLGKADLAVLEHFADPRALLAETCIRCRAGIAARSRVAAFVREQPREGRLEPAITIGSSAERASRSTVRGVLRQRPSAWCRHRWSRSRSRRRTRRRPVRSPWA